MVEFMSILNSDKEKIGSKSKKSSPRRQTSYQQLNKLTKLQGSGNKNLRTSKKNLLGTGGYKRSSISISQHSANMKAISSRLSPKKLRSRKTDGRDIARRKNVRMSKSKGNLAGDSDEINYDSLEQA
jgi:hypothetical protein